MSSPSDTFTAPTSEEIANLFPDCSDISFIAQGGMGAVYSATQTKLDRRVAIKILPREYGEDEQFRTQFQNEARSMARLNHHNLIRVYDFGEVDGLLYIIMEFINGKALHYSSHGKQIEDLQSAKIVHGIALGVHHAHQADILHLDIKPANILLDATVTPKIGDFGLARPVGQSHNSGILFGTPGYSSPELLRGDEQLDFHSDIYSMGVILYELLTGELPVDGEFRASQKITSDHKFDTIIQKATAHDLADRYSSAQNLADDLNEVITNIEQGSSKKPTLITPPVPKKAPLKKDSSLTKLLRKLLPLILLALVAFGIWKFQTPLKKLIQEKFPLPEKSSPPQPPKPTSDNSIPPAAPINSELEPQQSKPSTTSDSPPIFTLDPFSFPTAKPIPPTHNQKKPSPPLPTPSSTKPIPSPPLSPTSESSQSDIVLPPLPENITNLRNQANSLVKHSQDKLDKLHLQEIKKFTSASDSYYRTKGKESKQQGTRNRDVIIQQLQTEKGLLPENLPGNLPPSIREAARNADKNNKSHKLKAHLKIEKIHLFYLKNLTDEAADLKKQGKGKLAQAITQEVTKAGTTTTTFIQYLGL